LGISLLMVNDEVRKEAQQDVVGKPTRSWARDPDYNQVGSLRHTQRRASGFPEGKPRWARARAEAGRFCSFQSPSWGERTEFLHHGCLLSKTSLGSLIRTATLLPLTTPVGLLKYRKAVDRFESLASPVLRPEMAQETKTKHCSSSPFAVLNPKLQL